MKHHVTPYIHHSPSHSHSLTHCMPGVLACQNCTVQPCIDMGTPQVVGHPDPNHEKTHQHQLGPNEDASEKRRIRVVVRVRPPIALDGPRATCNLLRLIGQAGVLLAHPTDPKAGREYGFDGVLSSEATQEDVYKQVHVDELVQAAAAGFNATVFAYGQTGSGKTFTMEGFKYHSTHSAAQPAKQPASSLPTADIENTTAQQLGIVPRAIKALFDAAQAKAATTQTIINVSFVQLYNEQAYDLLNPAAGLTGPGVARATQQDGFKPGQPLRMRWTRQQEFFLENLFQVQCKTSDEALSVFMKGVKSKVMASHQMNNSSSRSHTVLNLQLHSCPVMRPDEVTTSCLTLVDLAGSERSSATGTTQGVLRDESIAINKSLFTLRQVIVALAGQTTSTESTDPAASVHVPYRDSKLTALLKRSLGGNSLTTMVACITSTDIGYEENIRTLDYAALARRVVNKVHVNEDPHVQTIRELRAEVAFLRGQLQAMQVVAQPGGSLIPAPPSSSRALPGKQLHGSHQSPSAQMQTPPSKLSKAGSHVSRPVVIDLTHSVSGSDDHMLASAFADAPHSLGGSSAASSQQQQPPLDADAEDAVVRDVRAALTEAVEQDMQAVVQRLQGCAQVITRLTQTNGQLRSAYTGAAMSCEALRFENSSLMTENSSLRDRISMLEEMAGVVKVSKGASDGAARGGDPGSPSPAGAAALVELQELRQENALLHTLLQIREQQSGTAAEAGVQGRGAQVLKLDGSKPSRQAGATGRLGTGRGGTLLRSTSVQPPRSPAGRQHPGGNGRAPSAGPTMPGGTGALCASSNMLSVSQLRAMLSSSNGKLQLRLSGPAQNTLMSTTGQVLPRASLPVAGLDNGVGAATGDGLLFRPDTCTPLSVEEPEAGAAQEPSTRLAYLVSMRNALARGNMS